MKFPPELKRLIFMHRPYAARLTMAFCAMWIVAATEPAVPFLFKMLIDEGFIKKPKFSIWLVPLIVIGLFAVRGTCNFFVSYMMTWTSTRLLSELRCKIYDRLLSVPVAFYESVSLGKVISTLMVEVNMVLNVVTTTLPMAIRSFLTVLGLVSWLFYLNWKLTLIIALVLPFCVGVIRCSANLLKAVNQGVMDVNANMTQTISESTRAHQIIKIFGGQSYERTRFFAHVDDFRRVMMRLMRVTASTSPITQLVAAFALSLVVVFALHLASVGELTVGDFVSFVTAMLMLLTPMKQLAQVNGPLVQGVMVSGSIFNMIDAPIERTDGVVLNERAKGRVDYENVTFAYPGQEKPALDDVSLQIEPGETIALVGQSGGGKTTFVNLLPEFYTVTQGRILLDGIPINDISLKSLRDQMAMVSQNVILINDTIAANVSYGDPSPNRKRIEAAVEAAYLNDVVEALPQGLEAQIGDNGSRLSGGQRQRMAIARAIYKDAPILILDEATSALDSESERMVQRALDRLMVGRTTFVVAHRLSTVENADRIVVLSEGSIVEVGAHAELLNKQGVYANLYSLQFTDKSEKYK